MFSTLAPNESPILVPFSAKRTPATIQTPPVPGDSATSTPSHSALCVVRLVVSVVPSCACVRICGSPCLQTLVQNGPKMCCAVPCRDVLCCAMFCRAVLCCAVLCCAVFRRAVLCHAVMCCAVPCCAAPCCAVLCCAVYSLSFHCGGCKITPLKQGGFQAF